MVQVDDDKVAERFAKTLMETYAAVQQQGSSNAQDNDRLMRREWLMDQIQKSILSFMAPLDAPAGKGSGGFEVPDTERFAGANGHGLGGTNGSTNRIAAILEGGNGNGRSNGKTVNGEEGTEPQL